jgi:mono/diheme cytochrome c family protein
VTSARAAALLLAAMLASCTAWGAPQQPSVAYGAGEGAAAKLAQDVCAACHGEGLAGGRSSSLIDDTWIYGGSDADIAKSIRDGRPGTLMQPFGGALGEREIRSLVVLIRELSEKAKVEGGKLQAPAFDAVFKSERHAFKLETVFDGLDTPWGFAFLPDKRVIVTERPGRLRILTPGQPLAEPIRGLPKVWAAAGRRAARRRPRPRLREERLDLPGLLRPGRRPGLDDDDRARPRARRGVGRPGVHLQAAGERLPRRQRPLRHADRVRPRGPSLLFDRRPRRAGRRSEPVAPRRARSTA